MAGESAALSDRLARIKGAEVVKSFCYTCPWQCPTEVYVRNGRIVYHKGNPDAPNNIGTRCAKGMASWYVTQDPDRLKYPMRRTNSKSETGRFERISWDDAFSYIAEKLTAIKEKWGPEAVVYLTHHDPNSGFMISLLADLYGTPNISIGHAMGCEGDRRLAALTLFGDIFPMHDFENSRYVMLWGMNMFGANQGLFESRGLANAKDRGCKLVVIDPNFTETAQKADEWIPIQPGTDGALALAMCRVIVDEDLFDRDFVNSHCNGFDGFRDHLRDNGFTPEWAAPITGVGADTIARLAREFATTKPAMSALFKGPGYYTNGTDAGRAIYLLDALTGEVDKPGNLKLNDWAPLGPPVVIPDEAKTTPEKPPLAHALGYPLAPLTGYPVLPEVPNTRLPDAVLDDDPYPIRGIIAQATNPVMSDPNRDRVQEMFRNLELGVAIDLYMSETALECDIVLPETSFYEHAELRQGMWMGPEVVLCQPAVAPVGESKPMYEIVKGIADQGMGLGPALYVRTLGGLGRDGHEGRPHVSRRDQAEGVLGRGAAIQPCSRRPADPLGQDRNPCAELRRRGTESLPGLHGSHRHARRRVSAPAHAFEAEHALQHRDPEQSVPDGGMRGELGRDQPEGCREVRDSGRHLRHRRITQGQHPHQGQGRRGAGAGLRERAAWPRLRPLGHGRDRQGQGCTFQQPDGHPHESCLGHQQLQRVQGEGASGVDRRPASRSER